MDQSPRHPPLAPFELHRTALLLVDVQERLLPSIERGQEVLEGICLTARLAQLLQLPVVVTEQYPEKLGPTVAPLAQIVTPPPEQGKKSFSCMADPTTQERINNSKRDQWLLVGIEAHVCVLQTARDLLLKGYQVATLNDAVGSRSLFDYSSSLAEMRDMGARVSTVETLFFELLGTSTHPQFKEFSALIK